MQSRLISVLRRLYCWISPDDQAPVLRLLFAAGVLGTALLAVASCVRTLPAFVRPLEAFDFTAYYLAARVLNAQQPLYTHQSMMAAIEASGLEVYNPGYIYAPFLAAVLRPLAMLPPEQAMLVWLLLNVAILVIGVLLLLRALAFPPWASIYALPAVACWPATFQTLLLGQVNILLFSLLAASLYWSTRPEPRRRDDLLAGILAGVAAAIKLFPGVVALLFLAQRRLVALVGMGASVLGTLVVGLLAGGGWENTWFWLSRVLLNVDEVGSSNDPLQQSVQHTFSRLFETHTFTFEVLGNQEITRTFGALIEAPAVGAVAGQVCAVAILALTVGMVVLRHYRDRMTRQHDARLDFALLVAITTIVTPVVWEHYYVITLIPVFVLLRFYRLHPLPRWLLLAGCLLLLVHRYWRVLSLFWPSLLVISGGLLGSLCLWLGLLVLAHRAQAWQAARQAVSVSPAERTHHEPAA